MGADRSPVLARPGTALLLSGLLLGCALGVLVYGAAAVLVGTRESTASALAVAVQAVWQTLVVRRTAGAPWRWAPVQAAWALVAFGLAGAVGLSGGSAFFAVAAVVVVVMPVGGVAVAVLLARRRRAPAPTGPADRAGVPARLSAGDGPR